MGENGREEGTFLLPGAIFAKDGHYSITTVLGSCIAVCLWDSSQKKGGMNHYKLPLWNGEGLPSPKFGNIAIEKLLENMLDMDCRQTNLQTKVFGGGAVIKNTRGTFNVGERNIEVAHDTLNKLRIPITAIHVGDEFSRKVIFDTYTGKVMMKKARSG